MKFLQLDSMSKSTLKFFHAYTFQHLNYSIEIHAIHALLFAACSEHNFHFEHQIYLLQQQKMSFFRKWRIELYNFIKLINDRNKQNRNLFSAK